MTTKTDTVISEGERWAIHDILDGVTVMTFDDWSHPDAEARAWEAFEAYPRRASLTRVKVVKYEAQVVSVDPPEPSGLAEDGGSGS